MEEAFKDFVPYQQDGVSGRTSALEEIHTDQDQTTQYIPDAPSSSLTPTSTPATKPMTDKTGATQKPKDDLVANVEYFQDYRKSLLHLTAKLKKLKAPTQSNLTLFGKHLPESREKTKALQSISVLAVKLPKAIQALKSCSSLAIQFISDGKRFEWDGKIEFAQHVKLTRQLLKEVSHLPAILVDVDAARISVLTAVDELKTRFVGMYETGVLSNGYSAVRAMNETVVTHVYEAADSSTVEY